jgi:hypothetical protein
MITINIPTDDGKNVVQAMQPIDAGEKFTSIATYGIANSNSLDATFSGQAGLLNVEMSSNTNTAGETRLLVKVSSPYYAAKSATCGCEGSSQPTFAKSGTIGAHIVITLPKGFAKDYVASLTTWGARRQLNAVLGVLAQALSGDATKGDQNYKPTNLVVYHDDMLAGVNSDPLGLFESDGVVNRAIMGLRPAAPDKTYGRAYN